LEQRHLIEDLVEHRNHVVALLRQQWWWSGHDEPAEDNEVGALFTFEDGLISRWQPFAERDQALHAAGIEPPE